MYACNMNPEIDSLLAKCADAKIRWDVHLAQLEAFRLEMIQLQVEHAEKQRIEDDLNDPGEPNVEAALKLKDLTRRIAKVQRIPMKDIRLAIDSEHGPCLVGVQFQGKVFKPEAFKIFADAELRLCLNVLEEDAPNLRTLTPWRAWRAAFMHKSLVATVRMG